MFTEEEKAELKKIVKEATKKQLTKADIMKVKDRAERHKLIAENMDLFKEKEQE